MYGKGRIRHARASSLRDLQNPLGMDQVAPPRLSWQSDSVERNWEQAAYEILVAADLDALRAGHPNVWDSGKIASSQSVGVIYAGPKLESQKRYYWRVRVWDTHGKLSESQEQAWWEMGLLGTDAWRAQWIT